MSNSSIHLAIFDMAGTTVHDNHYVQKIFQKSFAQFGLRITPQQANSVMGLEKNKAIRELLEQLGASQAQRTLAGEIYQHFTRESVSFYLRNSRPAPYSLSCFNTLRRHGILIALNTGFSEVIMNTIIRCLDWNHRIDDRISSDQVRAGRPEPFMIRRLQYRLKIDDPSRIAKIGDTPSDLLEGAICGLNIGICSGNFPREELMKYPHTHLVGNLKSAAEIIINHREVD